LSIGERSMDEGVAAGKKGREEPGERRMVAALFLA
jgi:hypothetical protein